MIIVIRVTTCDQVYLTGFVYLHEIHSDLLSSTSTQPDPVTPLRCFSPHLDVLVVHSDAAQDASFLRFSERVFHFNELKMKNK